MDELTSLARAAGRGDRAALARLVRETQGDVWRLCAYLVDPAAADDLAQDTYLRAIPALRKFRGDAPVRAWLLAIARRACAAEIGARSRDRRLAARLAALPDGSLSQPPAEPGAQVAADALLAALEPGRRAAFVLTQMLGCSYAEAAAVCGCPVGTIRSRVARAREDLDAMIAGQDPAPGSAPLSDSGRLAARNNRELSGLPGALVRRECKGARAVPGMNSGLDPSDPTLEAAFRSALLHQGLIAAAVFVLLLLLWGTSRGWVPEQAAGTAASRGAAESAARRVLRIGFGLLWLFDGILQAQPKMPGGLPSQVIEPAAQASPHWVQDVVNAGGTIWSDHPITVAAASVWIQVGIGVWLLAAPRGRWSRAAGLASVAWGLVVWGLGESFGGIFAPGLSWLTGAPGAVLLYCVAGALIVLPPRVWDTARTGRLLLAGAGVFFVGMAVLQAWPGRGYWQGTAHGQPGTLAGMVAGMAQASQPHVLSAMVSAFGTFDTAHGFAVNLFVVIVLAATGAGLLSGRRRLIRAALIAAAVLCLADWVLVQDFGFLGGLGTDPNSMIPTLLLLAAGYLALKPRVTADQPAAADAAAPVAQAGLAAAPATTGNWPGWLRPHRAQTALAAVSIQTVTALGAVAVVAIGAAPMAAASVNRTADPIIAEAISGYSPPLDTPASPFRLTDQHGRTVTLASLRGKAVLLTFLDPVCTVDCPLIAQEFKAAGALLGAQNSRVELVAIAANPTYYSIPFTQAFDQQEGLSTVPNWLYLTGPLTQLQHLWSEYGIDVQDLPAGAMSAHNDLAFVIDPAGVIRQEISDDPGPATTSTQSSFGGLLAADARDALSQP